MDAKTFRYTETREGADINQTKANQDTFVAQLRLQMPGQRDSVNIFAHTAQG